MRTTTTRRTVVLVAAGTLGLAGIVAAGPALAGAGLFPAARTTLGQPGPGDGSGYGTGMGMGAGIGMGAGGCLGAGLTAPQGT